MENQDDTTITPPGPKTKLDIALFLAATKGYDSIVRILLGTPGVNLNPKDEDGRSPLSCAAGEGHVNVVNLLLDNSAAAVGGDVNSRDTKLGQSPLCWAVKNGHQAVVTRLLACVDVDPNLPDWNGHTPLYLAVEKENPTIARLLLQGNADPGIKESSGRTPLLWAAEKGYEEVVRLLIDSAKSTSNTMDVDATDDGGRTPLWWASRNGHLPVVQLLVRRGANMEAHPPVEDSTTSSSSDGSEKGAQPPLPLPHGTPLYQACRNGHYSVVKYLVKKGADINSPSGEFGRPLLLTLVMHDSRTKRGMKILQYLLHKNADANVRDNKTGQTPLHLAARDGDVELTALFLQMGASANVTSTKETLSMTPLHHAVSHGHDRIVELLLSSDDTDVEAQNESGDTPLHLAAARGDRRMVALLLENDTDANATNNAGETPLHKASENGHRKMVDFLIKNGAEINLQDDYGRTALHKAVSAKSHVLRLLVNKNANVLTKDMLGQTVLHMAATAGLKNDVHFLLSHGAEVGEKDKNGRTAQDLAAKSGMKDVEALLKSIGLTVPEESGERG